MTLMTLNYNPKKLDYELIHNSCSLSNEQKKLIKEKRNEIKGIIQGKNNKKIVVVGPCSFDSKDNFLEYSKQMKKIKENCDNLLIVLRGYSTKPRTKIGWKGFLLDGNPKNNKEKNDINKNIIEYRQACLEALNMGFPIADELLYPEIYKYVGDVLTYGAIGARTSESQIHRELSNRAEFPVGIKNTLPGDDIVQINSLIASQSPNNILFDGELIKTNGNPDTHAILRGTIFNGEPKQNISEEKIQKIIKMMEEKHLNPKILIDLNHDNSFKGKISQKEVYYSIKEYINKYPQVVGYMIESYIKEGKQSINGKENGLSHTDYCLSIDNTEKLLKEINNDLNF